MIEFTRVFLSKCIHHILDLANENIEYTVQLNKQNGPIGITISGSDVTPREIVISAVTQGQSLKRNVDYFSTYISEWPIHVVRRWLS